MIGPHDLFSPESSPEHGTVAKPLVLAAPCKPTNPPFGFLGFCVPPLVISTCPPACAPVGAVAGGRPASAGHMAITSDVRGVLPGMHCHPERALLAASPGRARCQHARAEDDERGGP
eukprot:358445-Chlamydomonas_euryale.AAC.38